MEETPELNSQKEQRMGFVFFSIYEAVFLSILALLIYWVVTLNISCLAICAIMSLLQSYVNKRSDGYIRFVNQVLRISTCFKIRRYYEEPVPDAEKTLFSFHPHAVFAYGVLMNLNRPDYPQEKMSKMVALGSRFMLNLPILGLLFRFWGVESVDPENIKKLMKKGVSLGLLPGGYEEATITTPKEMRFFINQRKGFIKYALKYGYTIRPTIIMNEHQALWTYDGLLNIRLLLNKLKLPGVIFGGKYGLFYPPNVRMDTIIGRGLKADKVYLEDQNPTQEEINKFHSIYIRELTDLYEKHKEKNGDVPLKLY